MKHIIRPIDINDCWEWTGYKTPNGYGWCRFNGKSDFAHRVAYRMWKGEIPDRMVIRHRCHNKCVNPAHLDLGTYSDNQKDRVRDGTAAQGTRNHMTTLTDDQVREIRERRSGGEKLKYLSEAFGVGMNTVSRICARKTWGHID